MSKFLPVIMDHSRHRMPAATFSHRFAYRSLLMAGHASGGDRRVSLPCIFSFLYGLSLRAFFH